MMHPYLQHLPNHKNFLGINYRKTRMFSPRLIEVVSVLNSVAGVHCF